ncbi:MAG: sensor histidine kinase [Armatimonadota bacterium]
MNIQQHLLHQTKPARVFWGIISFLLVLMLAIVDYNTDVDLMVFYFVPIVTAAVLSHEYYAFILSILSAFAWTAAELFAASALASKVDYANQALARLSVVGVDMMLKLAVFLFLTYGISLILYSRRRQEELTQFIVHDLRSPLTNVKTGLLTLEMISGDQLDETGKEMVNISLISADRLMWMINSLLDLPRLESKRLKLQPKSVLIDDIYEEAQQQVALWSKQNRVELQFHAPPQPLHVVADPAILTRVMVNLLSNALKYSPENSVVDILAEQLPNGSAQISVSDKGPGIDSEWAGKVFDKYTQMDARKAGAASSGLGLTFCRLAVRSMGGHIWIDSTVGVGTTVRFVLPIAT